MRSLNISLCLCLCISLSLSSFHGELTTQDWLLIGKYLGLISAGDDWLYASGSETHMESESHVGL